MAHSSTVILIVEDESLLRMDAAEMLEGAGFEVIQASDADEAIAILSARSDVHVVFTDIQMPGSMDGLKLARFVRHRWPPIKIIATSGHAHVEDSDLPAGSLFLPKPYQGAELIAALRDLIWQPILRNATFLPNLPSTTFPIGGPSKLGDDLGPLRARRWNRGRTLRNRRRASPTMFAVHDFPAYQMICRGGKKYECMVVPLRREKLQPNGQRGELPQASQGARRDRGEDDHPAR